MEEFDPVLLCPDCEVVRTEHSRHCSICNRCVERFDHHCPWVNNCVGTQNQGMFVIFLVLMELLLLSTAVVVLLNMECHKNADLSRNQYNFFIPMLLPRHAYDKVFIAPIVYFCAGISAFFALPVT